jgi:TATA-binding protein-associated factor Taf7
MYEPVNSRAAGGSRRNEDDIVGACTVSVTESGDSGKSENQEPRTENQEPRTKNQEPGTENREPRTENQEPRTENQEPRTENQELRAYPKHCDLFACGVIAVRAAGLSG